MNRDKKHPVWNVYDLLRTARLNVLYYSYKLDKTNKIQFIMQIILAATVPSSTIAGLEIWNFGLGKYSWEVLAILSSIFALIQPLLNFSTHSNKYKKIIDGYKILYYDLNDLKQKIEEDKSYSSPHKKLFNTAKVRRKKLEVSETGIALNKRLRRKCQKEVKNELPACNFYIPEENK